ncbi:hypothetical protein KY092_15040 [Natronomonas gomsonensis]|uniref:hypothetical protein n=1 Tax=Natronomonas gomsonensis TaxID=1046043 RepID=UPI0020CA7274|nr:hypothetical protein [Natronomonas gomsonensis]MCY4731874.1 hypothetical protein [Natronomonas gomsonensis]
MNTPESDATDESDGLVGRGYRITVDEGRESFFALSIEDPDSDTAWLMSDTVRSLEEMR